MTTLKRICIKDNRNGLKFGDTFECTFDGSRIYTINGEEVNTWITLTDLDKFSVEVMDMRDLKLRLLVGGETKHNKRLRKKIQAAFKMNDYRSLIKLGF